MEKVFTYPSIFSDFPGRNRIFLYFLPGNYSFRGDIAISDFYSARPSTFDMKKHYWIFGRP
jgi:hypothetical protein